MGCVLGTPADGGERRSDSGAQHRGRGSQRQSVTDGGNAVVVWKEGAAREKQKQETRHTGDFPGTVPVPERRLDSYAKTEQGWPSWLMAVAGDAIRDWSPRRANTFEKLAKVLTASKLDFKFILYKLDFLNQC